METEPRPTELPPPVARPEYRLPFWLVLGAIACSQFIRWHSWRVNELRREYLEKHGSIEVPEALYFDGKWLVFAFPFLVFWVVLLGASALGVGMANEYHWRTRVTFWLLWFVAWGACLW